ncbi:MAG: sugar phosphate isomerase/epimerase family protein [Anaerolineae bacterium]
MYISARTQMFHRYSILDSLNVIKQLGFDGVEIGFLRADWSMISLDQMPVAAIRERLAQLGLGPNAVSMHSDYIFDDSILARIKETIPVVRDFGTHILIINGAKKRTGDDAEWQLMVERTHELVRVAEAHDVVLALEFEPDFVVGSTADLLRLFAAIPSPNLAANLDIGHVFLCDPDPLDAIARLGGKIVHCHIEDMPAGKHDHRLPGEGDMDLGAYIRALRGAGFDGAMALDLYAYDYEAIAKDTVALLHTLIEENA